jgi:hypothetical protein
VIGVSACGVSGEVPGSGDGGDDLTVTGRGGRGAQLAPQLLRDDRIDARPARAEGLILGDAAQAVDRASAEAARPLGVSVAQEQLDPLGGAQVAAEAVPARVGVRAETTAGGAASLDELQQPQRAGEVPARPLEGQHRRGCNTRPAVARQRRDVRSAVAITGRG